MSSSNSPCAACKFLRRKCTQECVFAPYFPPDNPQKFANVHRVFGASNVAKLLNELYASQREEAVNSLAYEAEARLQNPVYGCVGLISILQQRLKQLQHDLSNAKKELATYIGPQAMRPILQPPVFLQQHVGNASSAVMQHNMMSMMGIPTAAAAAGSASHGGQLVIREPQQQQIFEAQQQLAAVVAAREQQEMFRGYEQQHQGQQQQEIVRFNSGFEGAGSVSAAGFNQITTAATMSPSLAIGSFDKPYQIQTQQQDHPPPHLHSHGGHGHPLQAQLLLQPQQGQSQQQAQPNQQQQTQQNHQQQQQRSGSEEGRSVGPSR